MLGCDSKFYNSWTGMKARCLNKMHPKYKNYGGRGISVFEGWLTIEGFSEWAKNSGWFKGASIDRIDNNGNYCPENCRWVSVSANSRKKSTTKLTLQQAEVIRGKLKNGESERDLAIEYGVVHGTIWFIKNNITHVPELECSKKLNNKKK